jgi:hypothetical protein
MPKEKLSRIVGEYLKSALRIRDSGQNKGVYASVENSTEKLSMKRGANFGVF